MKLVGTFGACQVSLDVQVRAKANVAVVAVRIDVDTAVSRIARAVVAIAAPAKITAERAVAL